MPPSATEIDPLPQTPPRTVDTTEPAPENARWNFAALTTDVTFFSLGMSFLDMSAIVPLLLARLGATGPLIGALSAVRFVAFSVPQCLVAWRMHGLPRQKPFLVLAAASTRLPMVVLPMLLWHAADSSKARLIALAAVFTTIAVWALGDGLGYVPWMEIVARAFSARTRGRFFATTQMLSGLVTILVAAFVVTNVLHSRRLPFPHNYALLAALGVTMYLISLLGVLAIREPAAPPGAVGPAPQSAVYFGRMFAMLRSDPIFIRLTQIQLLVGFGAAAMPFYVLYATQRFHLPDWWGGTYQLMQAVSVVALTPVWTVLSERYGPAAGVCALALACLLGPVFAMTLGAFSAWAFGLVFLALGGSLGWGMWIVFNHYLLEHSTEEDRPSMVALLSLLFLPSAIYPCLGGLFVQNNHFAAWHGVPLLFMVTGVVNATGLALATRLPQPQRLGRASL